MGFGGMKLLPGVAVLVLVVLQSAHCQVSGRDGTLQVDAKGEEVVDAVIAKIGGLFGEDYGFFKRLAFANTEFGNRTTTNGGIWQVTEEQFNNTRANTGLQAQLYRKIFQRLQIRWRKDTILYEDLRKPLYSALALYLYLHIQDPSTLTTGFPQTLAEQAGYRDSYIPPSQNNLPDSSDFLNTVRKFEDSKPSCSAKMDFVVVLDGSGSVGEHNFRTCLNFVAQLFSKYTSDTVRLGFIVYGSDAATLLRLDNSLSASEIGQLVNSTSYPSSSTNTNAGILAALELFKNVELRSGVPKVMAVFTDGESNMGGYNNNGGVPDIAKATAEGITTYAVGIGQSTRQSELVEIAQGQVSRVFSLQNFDTLLEFFRNLHTKTCSESQTPPLGEPTADTLPKGGSRLYKFPWGEKNFRITTATNQGQTEAYYGSHPGINREWNEGKLRDGVNYIPNPNLRQRGQAADKRTRPRRDVEGQDDYYSDDESIEAATIAPGDYDYSEVAESIQATNNESIYIVVIAGPDPVNNYTIVAGEIGDIPAEAPSPTDAPRKLVATTRTETITTTTTTTTTRSADAPTAVRTVLTQTTKTVSETTTTTTAKSGADPH